MCYGLSFACGDGGGGGGGTSHQEMENYENIPLSLRLLAIRLLTV